MTTVERLDVSEFEEIEFPVSRLIDRNGDLALCVGAEKYFDIRRSGRKLSLTARGYVGVLPLTKDIQVSVAPKARIDNLSWMIAEALGDIEVVGRLDRSYEESDSVADAITDLLAEWYCDGLAEIERFGVWAEYERYSRLETAPRGRLNVGRTAKDAWARGKFHKASVERIVRVPEISCNRVIRAALLRILSMRSREGCGKYHGLMLRVLEELDSVGEIVRDDLVAAKAYAGRGDIPSTRWYYKRLIDLAVLILQGGGVSPDAFGRVEGGDSIVIDVADLFERFVRRRLSRLLTMRDNRYRVLNGNEEGRRKFYRESEKPLVTPDAVVLKDGIPNGIIDVKYKRRISDSDRYQLLSYLAVYDVSIGVFVVPAVGIAPGMHFLGSVGQERARSLYVYAVDLAGQVDHGAEQALVEFFLAA